MKKLHFTYEMKIEYSVPVNWCNFTIKCIPKDNARQRIKNTDIYVQPPTRYCQGVDGLQNLQIYGVNRIPHDIFVFRIEGDAITGMADYEEEVNENLAMIFRHPHGFNVPGTEIKQFYEKHRYDGGVCLRAWVEEMMHLLYQEMEYIPCHTTIDTSAEEAFTDRKGVCQDYAHIFIALMHLAGIPARYVTGLIVGEGASHAWVEILEDDKWYGYDPTNDTVVGDEHIKIGVGRDAADCMINRGIMHGGGLHTQIVSVSVMDEEQ